MNTYPVYRHRQIGWAILAGALIPMVMVFTFSSRATGAAAELAPLIIKALVVLAVLLLLLMGSLEITVSGSTLEWCFAWGPIRKRVQLSDIVETQIIRTTASMGWGIRITPRGMLYNVSGFDAVLVHLSSGKSVLLGTDEPARLKAAIDRATGTRGS